MRMSSIPENLRPPEHMSWKMVLAQLSPSEQQAFLDSLGDAESVVAANDWFFSARREQMAPLGDWAFWLFLAGRGAGKNYAASNWLIEQHQQQLLHHSFIVAATAGDLRRFCLEGPSGVLSLAPKWFYPEYLPSKAMLKWPNGSDTLLYSAEEPDRLRGGNHDGGWADEFASWKPEPDASWQMLLFTLRLADPKVIITTTPRPLQILRDLLDREGQDVVVTRATTYDNKENLSKVFINTVIKPFENTRLGRQELLGQVLFDVDGALWSYDLLERCRKKPIPLSEFIRIGIAVDPAVSTNEKSDETGIVAGGRCSEEHYQIIGDFSMAKASPTDWGRRVVNLYHELQADIIIAEKNQGGDLVEQNIRAVDPTVNIKLVHATRGKVVRAEPVATLYERGLVSHAVGANLTKLEDQLCTIASGKVKKSPDRADALVWLLSELALGAKMKRAGAFGR